MGCVSSGLDICSTMGQTTANFVKNFTQRVQLVQREMYGSSTKSAKYVKQGCSEKIYTKKKALTGNLSAFFFLLKHG